MGCGIEEDDGNDGVVASVIKVMDRSDRLGVGWLNAGRQAYYVLNNHINGDD